MGNLTGFDASNYDPNGGDFEPMPIGDYMAVIGGSEFKDTKAGDGSYLALTIEIVQESHKGRLVWDNLNLQNKNEKAVAIANSTLSAICNAIGIMRPDDSAELHNKPMIVTLGIEEYKGKKKNVVKKYSPMDGAPATLTSPANSAKPPWQK